MISRLCGQVDHVVFKIQKGASNARSDDTKSLKSAIVDWITPRGEHLSPSIARNSKVERGFGHDTTGALLCPAGMDWSDPVLVPLLLHIFNYEYHSY